MRVALTPLLAAATLGMVSALVVSTLMRHDAPQEELLVAVSCPAPAGPAKTISIYDAGNPRPLKAFPVTAFRVCGPPLPGVSSSLQSPEYAEANGQLYYLGQGGGALLEYRKPGSSAVTIELLTPQEEVISTP